MSWSGYIPGDLVAERRTFLRDGSIRIYRSVEGTGIAPGIEDYPFQGLDIVTEPYDYEWLWWARENARQGQLGAWTLPAFPAGGEKYAGRTPLGTSVAELARKGEDILAAPCGYCGWNLGHCKCGKASENRGELD